MDTYVILKRVPPGPVTPTPNSRNGPDLDQGQIIGTASPMSGLEFLKELQAIDSAIGTSIGE
jgi:hypothetical protein